MEPNIGQIVATAWEAVMTDKPTDNIFTIQALLNLLGEEGSKEEAGGGRLFEYDVEYAINTTFRGYAEDEDLDTTRINVFDAARYDQKIFAGTVNFSDLELARSQDPNRKVDILTAKIDNGKNSAAQQLNGQLFGDGTGDGGNAFDGLAKIISSTPTTGTVGGINAATFPFWRNRQTAGTKTSTAFDNLPAALRSIYNQCSLGGVKATVTGIVTDRTSFEGYEASLVTIERIVRDGGKATGGDSGFINDAIKFKACAMMYDEQATSATAYFVNNKFLKLAYLKGYWMKLKEKAEPANALMQVYRVETFGNLCASARRHLGVVTAIS